MIILRNYVAEDALILQKIRYANLSIEQIEALICEWNQKQYDNKYFEMFAIVNGTDLVGSISLYHHSTEIISIGPEIFKIYRKNGLAKEAMAMAVLLPKAKDIKLRFSRLEQIT